MSSACQIPNEQLCGCCTGVTQETPQLITNRPALSSIAYRAGIWSTFRASMLASLSDPDFPALAQLRTRDSSDFSIALIDSWAIALDILTFYQERFANEAFLRTAVDQRSVFELARLVGYLPSPGVSASAVLAFTLSSAPGSPDNVVISAGTRVQSVPGPGQKPQVFETSSDITAVIACNAIPAQITIPWQISGSKTSTWIVGTANNINVGDALLFVQTQSGQPVLTGPGDVRFVTGVNVDSASGNTQIFWDQPLSSSFPAGTNAQQVSIYAFGKKAALYGVQAPNPVTLTIPNISSVDGYSSATSDWNFIYTNGSSQINLDASYAGLAPQTNGPPQWIVLSAVQFSPSYQKYISFFQIQDAVDTSPGYYTLTLKTTQLTLALGQVITAEIPPPETAEVPPPDLSFISGFENTGVFSFRDTLKLPINDKPIVGFGTFSDLQTNQAQSSPDVVLNSFVSNTRNTTAWIKSAPLTPADIPITQWTDGTTWLLSDGMIVPVQGNSLSIVGGQQITSGQPIGVSGRRARLSVLAGASAYFVPAQASAAVSVSDNQMFLIDSYPPSIDATSGNPVWTVLTTSGVAGSLLTSANNIELQPSDKSDPYTGEAALVSTVEVNGNTTSLGLKSTLTRIYDAPTATVNANAVEATNGETVQEILGSGDASNDALQFTLKQSPPTYVTAATGNGTQSTLEVWVNNLQWHEVPNLLSSGPSDRVFITRTDGSGNTVVQFGNGVQGACTPTGQSNIRAVYRKGIGLPGMVNAAQLSQPLDRPQGLRSVTNPGAATGAADPASATAARASAPLPTLTIGRVVSLEDYQNFAIAFAGIAKAIATWTRSGGRRGVFLTVAGENGSTLQSDDPIVTNLVSAIQSSGNPYIPLYVASYVPVLFQFAAAVHVDTTNYDCTQVLAQVWTNVSSAFAFDQRQPGQNVVASQIVGIIQQTPGVVAVQLQSLNLSGYTAVSPPPAILCASGPQPPLGAQILLLDPVTQNNIGVWS